MFKSHTSNLRTDATTVARRVREEKESEEKELGKRVSRKEDHSSKAREKAEKYETLCFPKFCGSRGSKAGSLKRRTQSHLVARHCGAKRTSASQRFLGSQLLNKVRASVARSRFPSPNAKKTPQPRSTHWKLSCQETAGDCKRSKFPSGTVRSTPDSDHFWTFKRHFRGRRTGFCTLLKMR